MSLDSKLAFDKISKVWDADIVPTLSKYIEIPNQSPQFDPECLTNGFQDQAIELMVDWVKKQNVEGLTMKVVREPNRTPLIFINVDGTNNTQETVMMYGHMDKQPPMAESWSEGLGPWKAVMRDGKLYGRGGADDGYAIFASILAIQTLKEQKLPHSRIVILIEACEESGSRDLPHYMEVCAKEIGIPSLVICLDSGAGNYEQMWLTTSLRGIMMGTLRVKVLREGVHSGSGSGIVPSSFRVLRQLLDRVEDSVTGKVHLKSLNVDISAKDQQFAKEAAAILGDTVIQKFPWSGSCQPVASDIQELILNGTWRPTFSYVGVAGFPSLEQAGNVLRTETSLRLSVRLPPTADPKLVEAELKSVLESNPPYGAEVSMIVDKGMSGWTAPPLDAWLEDTLRSASQRYYSKPFAAIGEGGSIPFMGMLGERFPKTQFVITGVLGPGSNAHGPNEFIHIDFAKKLTACVTEVLLQHYKVKH